MPSTATRVLLAAGAVALLAGCAGHTYDEDAHRADVAEVLGVDEIDDQTWELNQENGEEYCESSESTFASGVGLALDSDDPEGHLELRRVNLEHQCPERVEELDEVLDSLR